MYVSGNYVFIPLNDGFSGTYQVQDKRIRVEVEIAKPHAPVLPSVLFHMITPHIQAIQPHEMQPNSCRYYVLPGLDITVKFGVDCNEVDRILARLKTQILPKSPILQAALQASWYNLNNVQFWHELSQYELQNTEIISLRQELRVLFKTEDLGFLTREMFPQSIYDIQLFRLLVQLHPSLLTHQIFSLLPPITNLGTAMTFAVQQRLYEQLEVICDVVKNEPQLLDELYDFEIRYNDRVDCSFKFLTYYYQSALQIRDFSGIKAMSRLLDNMPKQLIEKQIAATFASHYDVAEQWLPGSYRFNLKAAEIICAWFRRDLGQKPVLRYLLTEESLPNLTNFHLNAADYSFLMEGMNAELRAENPARAGKLKTKPFASANCSKQIHFRQAAYELQFGFERIDLGYYRGKINFLRSLDRQLYPAFAQYTNVQYQLFAEGFAHTPERLAQAIWQLIDCPISLLYACRHAMLLFHDFDNGFYHFFDPNVGIFFFHEVEVYVNFVTDWISLMMIKEKNMDEVYYRYEDRYSLLSLRQSDEGVCMSFCLDLAEKILKGNKISDYDDLVNLGYEEFIPPYASERLIEELLDRSQFDRVIQEYKEHSFPTVRSDLAMLIARGNRYLQKGNYPVALERFKSANQLLDTTAKELISDALRVTRKREIVSGMKKAMQFSEFGPPNTLQVHHFLPPQVLRDSKAALYRNGPWTRFAMVVPIQLSQKFQKDCQKDWDELPFLLARQKN